MLPHEPKMKVGDILDGRYRLVDLLGGGGMGFVYLAEDLRVHGRKRAIKEMKHATDRASFFEEAKMLSALNHPSLPQIVDTIPPESKDCGYIVMDYIPGETLSKVFDQAGKRLPYSKVIAFAKQICEIFMYLHEHMDTPVVYRDLKPSNLLVDEQERLRLIDFGIARFLEDGRNQDTIRLGTPGFAAPEQYAGRSGPASDLYNLGALLFYLLTGGQYPAEHEKRNQEMLKAVPPQLAAITLKLLHHNPDKRFRKASEVLHALMDVEKQSVLWKGNERRFKQSLDRKPLVAVGSLYAGAGATFIADSLAFFCAAEGYTVTRSKWDGLHTPPDPHTSDDLILCDIGSNWYQETDVQSLDMWADLIILVADPLPQYWQSTATERKLRIAQTWYDQDIPIHLIANRDVNVRGRNKWLRAFPWKPTCIVPFIDFVWVVESAWRGEQIQHHRKGASILKKALKPLLEEIRIMEKAMNHNVEKENGDEGV